MEQIGAAINQVLGLDRDAYHLGVGHACARAVVVFIAGLAIMRVGNRRFLAKATPFDVLLGFVLGSVLSRAISGTAAFLPTLAASLVIVILHRLLAAFVFNAHAIGHVIKGQPLVLIEEGVVRQAAAARARLTEGDIEEALRLGGVAGVHEVSLATIERNGVVSIVRKDREKPPPSVPD
jgi:uncharacterized membrane protein YcaP (DUF421 family)